MGILSWATVGWIVGVAAMLIYVVMVGINLYKVRSVWTNTGKEVLHFYDLKQFDRKNQESEQELEELIEYLSAKKEGRKVVLSERVRERFIPVTVKSVAVLTLFQFLETAGTIIILLLALGLGAAALIFFGVPI